MKKVLIIENAGDTQDNLKSILSSADFEIFFSHDKRDGLKIATRYLPDLILFCFTNGSGDRECVRKFYSDEALASVPLIVLAKKSSFEEQRCVMELGADDYIPFEFMEKSLLNSIQNRFTKLSRLKQSIYNSVNTFDECNEPVKRDDHILVKIGNNLKLVEFTDIVCITAMKEYSKMITKDNYKIIVRKSLRRWVKILPAKLFLRIHRATIININYIEKINRTNERTYTAHLKNIKETFDFSHRYANIMRRTFPT